MTSTSVATRNCKDYENSIKRGDIVWVDFGTHDDPILGGKRPALIVQNNMGNKYSPTVIVVPMTSKPKKHLPTHVDVSSKETGLAQDSILLVEQMRAINKSQIISIRDKVSNVIMDRVHKATLIALGMCL